ncbi:MAG: thiamine diphosphokinase [Clostridia bacterium]|nr:thiamine diphosphokinase [Clostridia bacterium]
MKVAIFSGGPFENVKIEDYTLLICADKGYLYARNLGLSPSFVLGDFDSLGFVPDGAEVFPKEKDLSDLELAIDKAISLNASEIDGYFCTGGRIDHELFNISLLKKCKDRGVKARLINSTQVVELISSADNFTPIKCKDGGFVSVLPYSSEVSFIGSSGLKYPLDNLTAKKGETLTLSNEATGSSLIIEIKSGEALLITERGE